VIGASKWPTPHGRVALMLEAATVDALLTVARAAAGARILTCPRNLISRMVCIMGEESFSFFRQSLNQLPADGIMPIRTGMPIEACDVVGHEVVKVLRERRNAYYFFV
jgi:hypothetical protein